LQITFLSLQGNKEMTAPIKDYSNEKNSHYDGVGSWYGKHVLKQMNQQPKYCEPGPVGDEMHGEKRRTQEGPKIL
jgi:hypothetical protein